MEVEFPRCMQSSKVSTELSYFSLLPVGFLRMGVSLSMHYVSMFAAFVSLQMTIHFLLPHSLLRFKSMASIINLFALHDSWTGEQFVTNSAKSSIGNLNKHWSWLIVFQKNRAILFLIGRIYFCRWWLLKIKPIHHSHQHKCYGTLTHTRARAFTPVVNAV